MAIPRSSLWFFSIALALFGCTAQNAAAKPRDLSNYPLRVQIFQSDWSAGVSFFGHGSGVANLIDGTGIRGFDFTYECPIHYMQSLGNQLYVAKWKKPEKTLELIGSKVGKADQSDTCEFKVSLHNFVYDVQNGTLSTFTSEQYKVRNGMVPPKSGPIDTEVSHYPLRLSVLEINWTPPVNGSRTASGRGNLRNQSGVASVDFTADCQVPFSKSDKGRYYAGQWTQEGSAMAVLLRASNEEGSSFLCMLKTNVHTDVYVLDPSGVIKPVSREDYSRTH